MQPQARLLGVFAVLAAASSASAAVVTGNATLVVNPFNLDANPALDAGVSSSFGNPSTGATDGWAIVNAPDLGGAFDGRHSHEGQYWTWLQKGEANPDGEPVYAQWTRPASFQAGTLIYDIVKYSYSSGVSDYSVKVSPGNPGNTTDDWDEIDGGGGTASVVSTSPIYVHTLDSVVNANSLRVEFDSTTTLAGANNHAFIDEVTVLPDRYVPLTPTSVSVSGEVRPRAEGHDANQRTQWYDQGNGNEYFQLNFGSEQAVDGLVVYMYVGYPSDFEIYDDSILSDPNAQPIATVTQAAGFGQPWAEVIPLTFDSTVTTSSLRLVFTTNQRSDGPGGVGGMADIVALQLAPPIPEPTVIGLMSPLAVLLVRRCRMTR